MRLTLFNVVVAVIIAIAFAAANAAYLVWAERRGAARIQRRPGPNINGPFGLLQPPLDGIKLMAKQLTIPGGADKILFITAPVLAMFPAIMSFVTIPFSENIVAKNMNVGILMIFAFAALGSTSLLFAGWSSRNKYAMMASIRAVSQTVAYEIPITNCRELQINRFVNDFDGTSHGHTHRCQPTQIAPHQDRGDTRAGLQ